MSIDRRTLKAEARQIIRSARPHSVLVTLLLLLLTTGLSTLISVFISDPFVLFSELTEQGLTPNRALLVCLSDIGPVGLFLHILVAIFTSVISFGYLQWALNASRKEEAGFGDLLGGFSMVGKVLWLKILSALYCAAWVILLIMAGTLLLPVLSLLPQALVFLVALPFVSGLIILGIVLYAVCYLRCIMAPLFLLDDPEQSAMQALQTSLRATKGHTAQLFLLYLSFIGWSLLVIPIALVAGVLGLILPFLPIVVTLIASVGLELWLVPYTTLSLCRFYDNLPRPQTEQNPFEL